MGLAGRGWSYTSWSIYHRMRTSELIWRVPLQIPLCIHPSAAFLSPRQGLKRAKKHSRGYWSLHFTHHDEIYHNMWAAGSNR